MASPWIDVSVRLRTGMVTWPAIRRPASAMPWTWSGVTVHVVAPRDGSAFRQPTWMGPRTLSAAASDRRHAAGRSHRSARVIEIRDREVHQDR